MSEYINYKEYLKSDAWKEKKEEVFAKRGKYCELCGSTDELDVHHRTYERLGHEYVDDLMVLCRSCHTNVHAEIKGMNFRQLQLAKVWVVNADTPLSFKKYLKLHTRICAYAIHRVLGNEKHSGTVGNRVINMIESKSDPYKTLQDAVSEAVPAEDKSPLLLARDNSNLKFIKKMDAEGKVNTSTSFGVLVDEEEIDV